MFLRASPSSFLRKEPYVTGFTFVSPLLHDEVPSPLPQEGGWRCRRRRIGASVLPMNFRCSSGLRPAPFRSGKQKEGPFMGRLRANFARLGNPMQDCHLRKEPYVTSFTFVSPLLHDKVPEPPSSGRGWRRQATEDSRPFAERPRPRRGLI